MFSTNIDGTGARLAVPVTTERLDFQPQFSHLRTFYPKFPFLSRSCCGGSTRAQDAPESPRSAGTRPEVPTRTPRGQRAPYALLANFLGAGPPGAAAEKTGAVRGIKARARQLENR